MTDENNASNEINEANEEKKVSTQKRKSTNRRGNYNKSGGKQRVETDIRYGRPGCGKVSGGAWGQCVGKRRVRQ